MLANSNLLVDLRQQLLVKEDNLKHELPFIFLLDVLSDKLIEHRVQLVTLSVPVALYFLHEIKFYETGQIAIDFIVAPHAVQLLHGDACWEQADEVEQRFAFSAGKHVDCELCCGLK